MPSFSSQSGRRLIVNGDDFGLSPQVNRGIIHAHRHGILTNTSLMVTGRAWQDAVTLAQETPGLGVGLHLTLVHGRAVLPPHLLPDITSLGGNFSASPAFAGLQYFFSQRARTQIQDECRAQIERLLGTGLSLAQVDDHLNIHMHPVVLDILLDLAQDYGLKAMRLTCEYLATGLALDARHVLRKRWESFIFTWLSRSAKKKLRAHGIISPDSLF